MNIDWIYALVGGALIGVAVSLMLFLNGRVTGISGIISGSLYSQDGGRGWRMSLLAGLIAGGVLLKFIFPQSFAGGDIHSNALRVIVAGLLVGFGTLLGSGCTSGHGVCGISRMSIRSVVATLSFMAAGILAVALFKFLFPAG